MAICSEKKNSNNEGFLNTRKKEKQGFHFIFKFGIRPIGLHVYRSEWPLSLVISLSDVNSTERYKASLILLFSE